MTKNAMKEDGKLQEEALWWHFTIRGKEGKMAII